MAPVQVDRSGAVAYIRTSTSRQDLSPGAQRDAIRRWADGRGIAVISWHEDLGVKGRTEPGTRPGLLKALDTVRRKRARFLVAARVDRLARSLSVTDKIRLMTASVGGHVVTADGSLGEGGDDPMTTFLIQIQGAVSELEGALIRHRVGGALRQKREQGRRFGSLPFGWRLAEHCECKPRCLPRELKSGRVAVCELLVPDRDERRAGARAAKLRAEGESLASIGRDLQARGLAPRGRKWHAQSVKQLLEAHAAGWGS